MNKCGKGCMPECKYFTTGGCISPFNCMYKEESVYINSATSGTVIYTGGMNMTNEELKKKICDIIAQYVSTYGDDEHIADALIAAGIGDVKEAEHRAEVAEVENAELRARLENAIELPAWQKDVEAVSLFYHDKEGNMRYKLHMCHNDVNELVEEQKDEQA